MANGIASSIAAVAIAIAPALLKFAPAPEGRDLAVVDQATVECIKQDQAPIHARYQSTGTRARLPEGSVVQVLSKRRGWRHIAYVLDGQAELGWVTTQYLEPCYTETRGRSGRQKKKKAKSKPVPTDTSEIDSSPHVMLGVPTDRDPRDDFLINHGVYVVSYNRNRNDPNWVSWKLTAQDLGGEERQNDFRPDNALPDDFMHITRKDYAGSGYDQGHMCPSAHRTATAEMNSLTFLMTNMQPQRHGLNAGPWKSLETFERNLVDRNGKEVYVVAGGLFGASPKIIGNGVAVPKQNFRITVVLDQGQRLGDVSTNTPIFAVEMPNEPTAAGHRWTEFKVTIDRVEQDSGYDFLSALPDNLEKEVEARLGTEPTRP